MTLMLPASSTTTAVFRSSSRGRRKNHGAKRMLRVRASSSSEKETQKRAKEEEEEEEVPPSVLGPSHATIHSSSVEKETIEVVTDDPREQLKRYQEKYRYSIRHPGAFGPNSRTRTIVGKIETSFSNTTNTTNEKISTRGKAT